MSVRCTVVTLDTNPAAKSALATSPSAGGGCLWPEVVTSTCIGYVLFGGRREYKAKAVAFATSVKLHGLQ